MPYCCQEHISIIRLTMNFHKYVEYLDFPIALGDSINIDFPLYKKNVLMNLKPNITYEILVSYNDGFLSKRGVPFDPVLFKFSLDNAKTKNSYEHKFILNLSLDEDLQFLLLQLENKIMISDLAREIYKNSGKYYSNWGINPDSYTYKLKFKLHYLKCIP